MYMVGTICDILTIMILHCGEAIIDMIMEKGGQFRPIVGGSTLNTAIASARLGSTSALLSSIAEDAFAEMILRRLEDNAVDTSWLVPSTQPSTLAFAAIDTEGNAQYSFYIQSTSITEILPQQALSFEDINCIQFGSISLLVEPSARAILDIVASAPSSVVRSFDPNLREMLIPSEETEGVRTMLRNAAAISDIVKLNEEELQWLFPEYNTSDTTANEGASVQFLLKQRPMLVCLTRGMKGGSLYTSEKETHCKGKPCTVADTVGAGDTFHGAVLAWLETHNLMSTRAINRLSEQELEELLMFAVEASRIACTRKGADPPTLHDLQS